MGHLLELFAAPQGEGVLVGTPMLFLRLSGCRVGCRFCDTRRSWPRAARGRILWNGEGVAAGSEPFENPVPVKRVLAWARAFRGMRPGLAWASLTGGEPLEQPAFAAALARGLKAGGWKVYLETAGVHPAAMRRLAGHVAFVSMDWKLGTGRERVHRAFLRAAGGIPGQVKAVVGDRTAPEEVEAASRSVGARFPFVLQPLTPLGRQRPPGPGRLARLAAAARHAPDLRVLGQVHRLTAPAVPL